MAQVGIQREKWQHRAKREERNGIDAVRKRKMEMRRENRSRQEESGEYRNATKAMQL